MACVLHPNKRTSNLNWLRETLHYMQSNIRARSEGFTLLELMLVVAIISILAATSMLAFSSYVKRSKTGEAPTLLKNLAEAQASFRTRPRYNQVNGAEEAPCWVYSDTHPSAVGVAKTTWQGTDGFNVLGFGAAGQVYYAYGIHNAQAAIPFGNGTSAGFCTVSGSSVTNPGSPASDGAIIAWGDLTGDAVYSSFARFMFGVGPFTELGGIYIINELE